MAIKKRYRQGCVRVIFSIDLTILIFFHIHCVQCVEGTPFLSRCPSSLYFDDIQKLCTFKNEAVCGPVATSMACFKYL
jgi:Chitin binding Peritrophin-A domain